MSFPQCLYVWCGSEKEPFTRLWWNGSTWANSTLKVHHPPGTIPYSIDILACSERTSDPQRSFPTVPSGRRILKPPLPGSHPDHTNPKRQPKQARRQLPDSQGEMAEPSWRKQNQVSQSWTEWIEPGSPRVYRNHNRNGSNTGILSVWKEVRIHGDWWPERWIINAYKSPFQPEPCMGA